MSDSSWMSLLSELTLGAGAGTVRAEVRADVQALDEGLRLVVQTYGSHARPLGSVQRAVTPAELRHGVSVAVPHVAPARDPRVMAWVERGAPDLEHDGLTARPPRGSFVGFGRGAAVRIRLSRR
jgi:hypothetical protein